LVTFVLVDSFNADDFLDAGYTGFPFINLGDLDGRSVPDYFLSLIF